MPLFLRFCGLFDIVKVLIIDNSHNADPRSFRAEKTPLHLASQEGRWHVEVERFLFEDRADAATQDELPVRVVHSAAFSAQCE